MNENEKPRETATPLWSELLRAAERVECAFETSLAEAGLSLSKLGVLRTLVAEGEPIPLSRLAGKLACVKSNVTQLVDRLEADGLVVRTGDPSDRRSVLASVTPAGRERFEAGARLIAAAEAALLGGLASEERDRLLAVLHRIGAGDCGE